MGDNNCLDITERPVRASWGGGRVRGREGDEGALGLSRCSEVSRPTAASAHAWSESPMECCRIARSVAASAASEKARSPAASNTSTSYSCPRDITTMFRDAGDSTTSSRPRRGIRVVPNSCRGQVGRQRRGELPDCPGRGGQT